MAAEGPTAWSWAAFALLVVVAFPVGRWAVRVIGAMDRRERRDIERRRALAESVPDELRPARPPAALLATLVGTALAAGAFALALAGGLAALASFAVVIGAGQWRLDRDRRRAGERALARAGATAHGDEYRRLVAGLAVTYDLSSPGGLDAAPPLPSPGPTPVATDDGLPRLASQPPAAPGRRAGVAGVALRAASVPSLVGLLAGGLFGDDQGNVETVLLLIVAAMGFALVTLDRVEDETTRALVTLGVCAAPIVGWGVGLHLLA